MAQFNCHLDIQILMPECTPSCPYVSRIAQLETHYAHTSPLINKMDAKLDQVILGLGRVELLELKHNNHAEALNRAFLHIETLDKQVQETSRILSDMLSQIKGMTRLGIAMWTIIGSVVGYLFTKVI